MHRDSNLIKRNALVLPGGLLAFYALVGIVYVLAATPTDTRCAEPGQVVLGAMCFNPVRWLILFLLVGAGLAAFGLWRFQGRPETLQAQLRPGTGTHFSLALLASLFVLPLLVALVRYAQAPGATMQVGGASLAQWYVLLLAALVGLLMAGPFLALFLHQAHLRRTFLRNALEGEAGEDAEGGPPARPRPALEVPAAQAAASEPQPEPPTGFPPEPAEDSGYWEPEHSAEPSAPEPAPESAPAASAPREDNPWAVGAATAEGEEEDRPLAPGLADEASPPEGFPEDALPEGSEAEGEPAGLTEEEDLEGVHAHVDAAAEGEAGVGLGDPLFGDDEAPAAPAEEESLEHAWAQPRSREGDVDSRVDQILKEHPEVEGVHYQEGDGCVAHSEDGPCGAPRRRDTKYCVEHGCHATTKAGEVCHNAAKAGQQFCGVHATAE